MIDARCLGNNARGMGLFAANMIKSLSKLDSANEYIVFGPGAMPEGYEAEGNFSFIRAVFPVGLSDLIEIPYLARKYRPDLVWFLGNNCSPFIPKEIKVVSTLHDMMFFDSRERLLSRHWMGAAYRRMFARIAAVRADLINTVSFSSADAIIRRFKLQKERVFITYNGLTASILDRGEESGSTGVVDEYGLSARGYFYTISGTSANKNLKRLIDAFIASGLNSGLKLVVTGVKDARRVSRDFPGVDISGIVFTRYVTDEEKNELLSKCKAFVFVSVEEGFGVPPLEAIALRKPVVLSDIPVMRELYGGYGLFVDPFSVENIAEGLKKILSEKSFNTPGIKELSGRFSWDDGARILLDRFNSLAAGEK